MSLIKIRFFSDFCSSEKCKILFEACCKVDDIDNYGKDKEIYITSDDDYTHAVILNKATPALKISKNNVLGLACEPLDFLGLNKNFIDYAKQHIGKYFIGEKDDEMEDPFVEHHGFMWFDHPATNKTDKTDKTKLMSIVFSNKTWAPGHNYRHVLVKNIIEKNLPIDIYGRGCSDLPENIKNLPNIKGEWDWKLLGGTEPFEDYKFTICIENFSENQYFSEKIITPIMCNTIPIYYGCKNIQDHVKDFYVPLTGDYNDDIKLIEDILEYPDKYTENIKTTKEEIFDNLNFIKNVKSLFLESL